MSFSDLDRAREISRRLAGSRSLPDPPARVGVAPPDPAGFVSLRRTATTTAAALMPTAPPPEVREALGSGRWDALLDWALSAASCQAGFVVDPRGLVVGCRGPLPVAQAEGLGSRLMAALDQARQMAGPKDGPEPSVTIQFGDVLLTAFAARPGDGSVLTIGLIGRGVVPAETRRGVARVMSGA